MGLQISFSQCIRAKDLSPYLRGFGISISSGDTDGNKFNGNYNELYIYLLNFDFALLFLLITFYSDLAVGSYLSQQVVLLRSRPIISLKNFIKVENSLPLDRKTSFFNISFCSSYSGPKIPLNVGEFF